MRILVADDDTSQRLYIAALLRRAGHECVLCAGGAQVLGELERSDVALVVSDVQMPEFDGLRVSRAIRAGHFGRYVYVLLLTAAGGKDDYVHCLEAGADDFMPKPVDPATLAARIKAAERILAYDQALQAESRKLALARAQLDADLAAAGQAQRALLPAATLRRLAGCSIAPLFIPAQHVSGDMFNYFRLDGGRLGFYAADVAGHGVRSALVAATLGHTISPDYFAETVLDASDRQRLDPARLAHRLNERFAKADYEDTYFTLLAGVIDCDLDTLAFCQAGHPHPLLLNAAGGAAWLGEGGMPVGLFADAAWSSITVPFHPGSRLIIHSDGITEAGAPGGELFGEQRLLDFMAAAREKAAASLGEALQDALRHWMGGLPNDDDVTMIVIER